MIVAFTGTRKGMTAAQLGAVKSLLIALMPELALHGGAIGADTQFDAMLDEHVIKTIVYPSRNDYVASTSTGRIIVVFPAMSPLSRDSLIASRCEVLIATPSQPHEVIRSGTWATIRYARAFNKDIRIIYPNGKLG